MSTERADTAGRPHAARGMAESFGGDAERYERTRPAYPDALIERVVGVAPGRRVLDVGCGTGIEALQLRAAGCAVLGVEPDPRMADAARRHRLEVEVATFEEWAPAGRVFDAVVAGTAWHWVDPVAGASKAADVLVPGGLLAPFWHVATVPEAVQGALASSFAAAVPSAPVNLSAVRQGVAAYQPILDATADGIRSGGRFGEPERWQYDWAREYTRDEWLDQLPTSGILTRLPADKVAGILTEVGRAIDALGGRIVVEYATVAVAAHRLGSARLAPE